MRARASQMEKLYKNSFENKIYTYKVESTIKKIFLLLKLGALAYCAFMKIRKNQAVLTANLDFLDFD